MFKSFNFVETLKQNKPQSGLCCSGPGETRTHDPLNAIEMRSQLRYRPKLSILLSSRHSLVDLAGFEPATSSVRLMRAPSCATGPGLGQTVILSC